MNNPSLVDTSSLAAVAADGSNNFHIRNHSSQVVVLLLLPEMPWSKITSLAAYRRMDCTVVEEVAVDNYSVVTVGHRLLSFVLKEGRVKGYSRESCCLLVLGSQCSERARKQTMHS